jgi:hypothetical protein
VKLLTLFQALLARRDANNACAALHVAAGAGRVTLPTARQWAGSCRLAQPDLHMASTPALPWQPPQFTKPKPWLLNLVVPRCLPLLQVLVQ